MEVFSKSYLKHVVETQGELFDLFARQNPACDTDDFIASYMSGKTRADIDAGQAYVCTMFSEDLLARFMTETGYQPRPGESMKGFMPDWIGRFYAYYQWSQKMSSSETLAAVPLSFLKVAYRGLHDLDLPLAVAKVGSNGNGLSSSCTPGVAQSSTTNMAEAWA